MFQVRTMSPEDFEFAVQITDRMKWGLAAADFEFMVELEPEGCFVLLEDSERIGLATTVNFGPLAWFGNLMVDESRRGRGAGSLLVRHSIEYLKSRNSGAIGLYAYTDKIQFYRRLGFETDSEFAVLEGKGSLMQSGSGVREAEDQDLQEIVELDGSCFGASRRKLLEPIIGDPDNLCIVSVEGERLVGYVVAKVYRQMGEIGPLVCLRERGSVAVDLLRAVLNRLEGHRVSACVPTRETGLLDALRTCGFSEAFRVTRMFFGSPVLKDCINVAESLERG